MAEKDRKGKRSKLGDVPSVIDEPWWDGGKEELDAWFEVEAPDDLIESESETLIPSILITTDKGRLDRIRESYELLKQFSPPELKILLNLKRNTSPKAWTMREDLLVLTSGTSNRELAEQLNDRNKEAVKKRLQLLRSKGLLKRMPDPESEKELAADNNN